MEAKRSRKQDDYGVSLPEDVIFDVLVQLPLKSLCRFRCVSRAWHALICDPAFTIAQKSRAGPHLVGVFFGGCSSWPPEVRVMDMYGNVVRVLEVWPLGKDDGNDVILGALQQQATTLLNVIVYRKEPVGATAMIIDPAAGRACTVDTYTPRMMSSFGRATPSGALKVLVLVPSKICMVATIMDGSAEPLRWRERWAPPFITSCGNTLRKAMVNGVIYFLPPYPNKSDAASSSKHRIAAFDLESEEWKVINGPALAVQEYMTWHFNLTEHKGCLALAQFGHGHYNKDHCAIIWLLIDINKSLWVKEYTIQMPRTWGQLIKLLGALDDSRVLFLVSESELVKIHNRFTYHSHDVIVSYNPSTKTFTKFLDIAMGCGDKLLLFTGSLLS